MNVFHAIVLGVVQGFTEFLPVSSSGHLVLLQNIFGISEGAMFFNVMLHFGTLIAVVAAYRKDIWAMLRRPFTARPWLIVLASVPAGAAGIALNSFFEDAYTGRYLGLGFLLTALLLSLGERFKPGKKQLPTVLDALLIGIVQAVAILPGVSRSGSTISGGLGCGLSRKAAADFSFLMSIPVILGSVVLEGRDVIKAGLGSVDWVAVLVGSAFALLAGFIAVRGMVRLLTRGRLYGFAVYALVLGAFVLLDQYALHWFFNIRPF